MLQHLACGNRWRLTTSGEDIADQSQLQMTPPTPFKPLPCSVSLQYTSPCPAIYQHGLVIKSPSLPIWPWPSCLTLQCTTPCCIRASHPTQPAHSPLLYITQPYSRWGKRAIWGVAALSSTLLLLTPQRHHNQFEIVIIIPVTAMPFIELTLYTPNAVVELLPHRNNMERPRRAQCIYI